MVSAKKKHRRDVVAQRIGGRQGINTAVQPSDFAFEGDEQSATGFRRRNALYITQRDILSGSGYGIRTHPLGQRIPYKAPETPCGMHRVGPEALQITDVLPVVAPLYPVEQRTPQEISSRGIRSCSRCKTGRRTILRQLLCRMRGRVTKKSISICPQRSGTVREGATTVTASSQIL